jgi:hypothetical protein
MSEQMLYGVYLDLFDLSPFLFCYNTRDKATQTNITLKDSIIVVLSEF